MTGYLNPVLEFALTFASIVLAPMLGLLLKRQMDRIGLLNDAEVRAYLDTALSRAIDYGVAEARRKLGVPKLNAEDRTAVDHATDLAAAYAANRVPDALARFGIEAQGLRDLLRARMPAALAFQSDPARADQAVTGG